MSLLKQIEDRGAVLEWSPIAQHANVVAIGTKDSAGTGFDDHGGELELHSLNFSDRNTNTTLLGSVRANSRFSSIAWSQMNINTQLYPMGLIAGGMVDGNIHVWDPAKVAAGDEDSLLASVEQHSGAICGLHFNPHKESSHLLASGGNDCEIWITSLERPDAPSVFCPAPAPNTAKHTADITKVAWNTQVAHIVASAAQNGSCYIWDLRQKRAWCELKDPSGGCVSDVAWNPDQGLHLVTASGDDKNPVLKLWDLRSSTSLPLATLQGHTEGILSISWCPNDPSLLLSCGKDNRTMLWDLFHLQPVYDLPSHSTVNNADEADSNVFGGLASSAGQRRYNVSWSPCLPAVVSASSFDRRIQFYSMSGAKSKIGRAPKWLRKPVGASFGFGGKLVSFDSQNIAAAANPGAKKSSSAAGRVRISQVVEDPELVAACDRFHEAMAKGEYKQFCELKAQSYEDGTTAQERQVWSLMNVICFGSNAREELLTHLGFDSATITAAAQAYVSSCAAANAPAVAAPVHSSASAEDIFGTGSIAAEDVAVAPVTAAVKKLDFNSASPALQAKTNELLQDVLAGEAAEPTIRQAIIVGNFEAAVECCLQSGLLAEALLLAQCGDQALRVKTQAAFFEKQHRKHPFLNVLHAVIRNELMSYVASSDLTKWRETLALLSTYGKHDEFPALCEALAGRLANELKDNTSATLCFMCAANVERTVGFWTAELIAANEQLGYCDTKALQNYIEKVVVFTHANHVDNLGPECANFFAKYGELLANQGRLDVAISYLKGDNTAESVLIDRLYNAGSKPAGSRPPPFPFTRSVLEIVTPQQKPVTPAATTTAAVAGAAQQRGAVTPQAQQQQQQQQAQQVQQQTAGASKTANSPMQRVNSQRVDPNPASRQQQQPVAAAPAQSAYVLPAGWVQLVDPNSGHTYYVNQATGQSQWEAPPSAEAAKPATPAAAPVATPTAAAVQPVQQFTPQPQVAVFQPKPAAAAAASPTPANPSIMQPRAAEPVPAAVTPVAPTPAAAPHELTPQEQQAMQQLNQIIDVIAGVSTTPAEKKQIVSVRQSFGNLVERLNANEVSAEVLQKLQGLIDCMMQRNFTGASAIQTDLANTAWGTHKEWIKGVKLLIQLASKK